MSTTEIMEALPDLSPQELEEVRKRTSALLELQRSAGSSENDDAQNLHRQMQDTLERWGIPESLPYGAAKRTSHWKQFTEGAEAFMGFVREHIKPRRRAEEARAVYVLLDMHCRRLREQGIPLSHRTLSQALKRTPQVVDDQFPGYLRSGLLPAIIRKKDVLARSV